MKSFHIKHSSIDQKKKHKSTWEFTNSTNQK